MQRHLKSSWRSGYKTGNGNTVSSWQAWGCGHRFHCCHLSPQCVPFSFCDHGPELRHIWHWTRDSISQILHICGSYGMASQKQKLSLLCIYIITLCSLLAPLHHTHILMQIFFCSTCFVLFFSLIKKSKSTSLSFWDRRTQADLV